MFLSFMFLTLKILNIFTAIKRNSKNTIMAFLLCRQICSIFHIPAVSLKHRFSICHRLWHILTIFLRSPVLSEASRLVAHRGLEPFKKFINYSILNNSKAHQSDLFYRLLVWRPSLSVHFPWLSCMPYKCSDKAYPYLFDHQLSSNKFLIFKASVPSL